MQRFPAFPRLPVAVLAALIAAAAIPGCGPGPSAAGDTDASDAADSRDGPDAADAPDAAVLPRALDLPAWRVASSATVGTDGTALSTAGYDDSSWTPARVPGTVAGAQVDAGLFGDPLFGQNLKDMPGWTFSFLPMPDDSPYAASWWWRAEFDAPAAPAGARTWLVFEGINYSANVWVNGTRVAAREDVVGTFREFRFDVTDRVTPGQRSAVAVEVFAPDILADLAIYFVDWNPEPPDYTMGLWMPARVETRGPVALRDPAVLAHLADDGSADLTLVAELSNAGDAPVDAVLSGRFDDRSFQHTVTLAAGETRAIALTPEDVPGLRLANPVLWWPYRYGDPHLYTMDLSVVVAGAPSDAVSFPFGVREVTAKVLPPNSIQYSINGRPILIRGAGWAPDIFYRDDPGRDRAEIAYVKDLGLNAIRLEGKMESHSFYDLCDREGILLMAGWCCCDTWEDWGSWGPGHREIAKASLETQLRRLLRHPSVFTWLNGSDQHPVPDVERMYLDVAAAARWNLPIVSNATETPSEVSGPSGMKMTGPYNWVPPNYWYLAVPDDPAKVAGRTDWEWMYGGAYGFNSESSPGFSVPPLDSLLRMLPESDVWPPADPFLFHSGGIGSAPERLRVYRGALEARLGPPTGVADFARKAQVLQYEAHRAMFEAQGRNKYFATGHIQWMLNQAWPGLIWQLYDFFLRPGGTYFGAKEALRPVHVQYAYDDRGVWVVNSTLRQHAGLKVKASVYSLDSALVAMREATVADLPPDGNLMALSLAPDLDAEAAALSPVFFVDLRLAEPDGTEIDRNFYWLAVAGDTYDWVPTDDNLPKVQVADQTALSGLAPVTLTVPAFQAAADGGTTVVTQTLENPTTGIAFFVEALLVDGATGTPILPVTWDDNYVSLLPGETRVLTARVSDDVVAGRTMKVGVTGWNVAP